MAVEAVCLAPGEEVQVLAAPTGFHPFSAKPELKATTFWSYGLDTSTWTCGDGPIQWQSESPDPSDQGGVSLVVRGKDEVEVHIEVGTVLGVCLHMSERERMVEEQALGRWAGEVLYFSSDPAGGQSPTELAHGILLGEGPVEEACALISVEEEFPKAEEFLPESHFDKLRDKWLAKHPHADPAVIAHLVFVAQVLHVFTVFGAHMKFDKSQFVHKSLVLLGDMIGEGKLAKDPAKLATLRNFPRPKTPKNISELLGLLQYLKLYMGTQWATVAKPLRDLLRKDAEWIWGPEQEASFRELLRLGCLVVELAVPNYKLVDQGYPFEIFADMSEFAVGGGLVQRQPGTDVRLPLAFMSKSLTASQMLWPAWTKELFSLKSAVNSFYCIIGCFKCIVWTDHANNARLETLDLSVQPSMHIRWYFTVVYGGRELRYFTGRVNWVGDGASRNPEDRDEAQARLLAVKTDPKSVLSLFNLHEYHDEAEAVEDFLVHEGSGATRTRVRVLFVPDFETTEPSQRLEALRVALCAEDARSELTFYVAPHSDADPLDPDCGFWLHTKARTEIARQRQLKQQALAAAVCLLRRVVETRPHVVVCAGQGCVPALVADVPSLRATAYEPRVVQQEEVVQMEAAWATVRVVHLVRPRTATRPGRISETSGALPAFATPRNAIVHISQDERSSSFEESKEIGKLYRDPLLG